MGASKTELFTIEQNGLAAIAKALGHPARIAIIEYLIKHNNCICGDLVNELPLAQPTVSQHLKELKLAGIIKTSTNEKGVCYCIDQANWNNYYSLLNNLFKSFDESPKICC
jgi:ArsR family transcriptional regulator, arsenate/arsenite/antimonite-responsive transcriptional repressor